MCCVCVSKKTIFDNLTLSSQSTNKSMDNLFIREIIMLTMRGECERTKSKITFRVDISYVLVSDNIRVVLRVDWIFLGKAK